jgi:hypothetical protein
VKINSFGLADSNLILALFMIIVGWTLKVKVYIIYCYTIFWGSSGMKAEPKTEEMRWQIIKAMLDEFPTLKEKTRAYLNKGNPR